LINDLNIKGALLEKNQLEKYLEQQATEHNITNKSLLSTYPIPNVLNDFKFITKVYKLLNEHIKMKINIHPAGEWLLDNYYIINENMQVLLEEVTRKKYHRLPGLEDGIYSGYSRIYVLAEEIVGHRDNKIEKEMLEGALKAYQNKKMLNMDELWELQNFLRLSIIKNISHICEKIYISQLEKERVIRILQNTITAENKKYNFKKHTYKKTYEMKCAFVEFMSYKLKKYGKIGIPYMNILEEQVNITGNTIEEMINKQHYSIALAKVSMGNAINSLKNISRINFESIFEEINGVEEILKKDPTQTYENMSFETKAYYRDKIKELSKETKASEIYIVNKALELSKLENTHLGYYLIDDGKKILLKKLGINKAQGTFHQKSNLYITIYFIVTSILTILFYTFNAYYLNWIYALIISIIAYIPITEIYSQVLSYIMLKKNKPQLIPKLDLSSGVPEEYATFVVIPTIINSPEKVKKTIHDLEVYYIANKSENIYFAVLGDCTASDKKNEDIDKDIVETAKKELDILNSKYKTDDFPKFHFIYRTRKWCATEKKYLGWERKRGLLCQFNELLIEKNKSGFKYCSIETEKIPKIKYVITLDSDTKLILNSAFELIGAMAHPLNKPITNGQRVVHGYGIIQPRVGIDLEISRKTLFTEIYAGQGGTDNYTNAISDLYQDYFRDAIYTGKGIYNLQVFYDLLNKKLPENTILSHDLLEGSYLKCGLATDILLMDGFPNKYNSYMQRNHRWLRGDWQILKWLTNTVENENRKSEQNPISELSKFKIIDNIRRSLLPIMNVILLLLSLKKPIIFVTAIIAITISTILDIINNIVFKKEIGPKQTYFTRQISGIKASIIRGILELSFLPYKAYISLNAICKTIFRLKTKEHLLEWTTAEESEKMTKNDVISYYKTMVPNIILGIIIIFFNTWITDILGALWLFAPAMAWYISQENKEEKNIADEEKELVEEIAKKTWGYFDCYMNKQNNYLPPDNEQEGRITSRTSSTNIGLGLLSIISAYDMKFITLENAFERIEKMLETIEKLDKWNGHLYNWYNTVTLEPLHPRYISTVDSGNFVGYLFVLKQFYIENGKTTEKIDELILNTDFSILYDKESRLFSIGYNIEEAKLTESYYDFLASESRQASLIAIAKKDVPAKHWNSLSRTLTTRDHKRGLISWSGTAFEYLMPNVNIKKYKGSLLDESCKFAIMNQIQYLEKIGIPWGMSESAYSIRDLNGNYQYKAFGIPLLGMKRGLEEELVIAPYASILAITEIPEEVIDNLKQLKKINALGEFGFYESIDYTPKRLKQGQEYEIVKTYMAHHQGLIMLSINNFLNKNIMIERFGRNPEIEAVDILLQERMPNNIIIKGNREKINKLKYADYESYAQRVFVKHNDNTNLVANSAYSIFMSDSGEGYSKYKNKLINRYKITSDEQQGMIFYVKNIKNKNIWNPIKNASEIVFAEDGAKFKGSNGNIEAEIKTTIAPKDMVEIRKIELKNTGLEEEMVEVYSYFEPVLSQPESDYAHPVFNNLFLSMEKNDDNILISRDNLSVATTLYTENECIGDLEFELDKTRFLGRNNLEIPHLIVESKPLLNKTEITVEPIIAFKRTIKILPKEKVNLNLIIAVDENKNNAISLINQYKNYEKILNTFSLSKARVEAEARYLGIKHKDIEIYQKLISYLIYKNSTKKLILDKLNIKKCKQDDLWKYSISGDKPILFVKVKSVNDIDTLAEILKFYEYCIVKNVEIDLVIGNKEENSYDKYVRDEIQNTVFNAQVRSWLNNGIYILENLDKEQEELFDFVSKVSIDTSKGNIKTILREQEDEYLKTVRIAEKYDDLVVEKSESDTSIIDINQFKYYNEYGGFTNDGKEYQIIVNENKLPNVWSHVIANENFGAVVTDNMGGYTWDGNSRLNRITAWNNNPTTDVPSEIIYLKCNNKMWTLNHGINNDGNNYYINYGFGYANFRHTCEGIIQENTIFVPQKEKVKINLLKLKNTEPKNKRIKIVYYIKPVLGEDELKTNTFIKNYTSDNFVIVRNLYGNNSEIIIMSSEKIKSYTGNKESFIGQGSLVIPDGLRTENLSNENGVGQQSCIAVELEIELDSYESKDIVLAYGVNKDELEKFQDINYCIQELENIKKMWQEKLSIIQVKTPIESLNIIMNGWAIYQTLVCRMWARTGYYQSGGAFGFRDQLQDTLGLKYMDSNLLKQQIIKCCKHQFIEGDVEHWWHEGTDKGIRTRFSDDLLWLPYAVCEYIKYTGNIGLLDEEVIYREGPILPDEVDEKYDIYVKSEYKESVYKHCIKAIEKGINLGQHGLMKIGSGDWNDGFSTVGNKGNGESVWLSFFVYDILQKFIDICKLKNDEQLIEKYENIMNILKKNLNHSAWDGRWYRRAFTDDGKILGTISNEECKIDSIAQSWSVISNAGDNDKKYISMENLENYLIDKENGIIKLLTPAFKNSNLEPGYIKRYPKGVRENGGQYTHDYCSCGQFLANMLEIKPKHKNGDNNNTPIKY